MIKKRGGFMQQKIKDLYFKLIKIYLDYRSKVDKDAGICFAYYLIMAIIPMCSIAAFLASLFNIDLTALEEILKNYVNSDLSNIIIASLKSQNLSFSSIMTIGVALYVVSKGINQLYAVSKNLFPPNHDHIFIIQRIIVIFKTLVVFVLLLAIIALLTVIPVLDIFMNLSDYIIFEELYLFLIFFVIISLLYKIIPDVNVKMNNVIMGSLLASTLMLILLAGLKLYFSLADYSTLYGPLASVVVIMISFTLMAEVLYIGMYAMFEGHSKQITKGEDS